MTVGATAVAGLAGLLNDDEIPLADFDAIPFVIGFVMEIELAVGFGTIFTLASLAGIGSIEAAAPRFIGTNFAWVKSLIERLRRNTCRSRSAILRGRGSGDVALVRVD